jgi:hypothetical protein
MMSKTEWTKHATATIYRSKFTRYPYSVEYKDDSLIARFGTSEEALQYARHMETIRQQMVVDKLKGKR